MGLDRFANFISKSISDGIEEINIDNNLRKIVSNHIIFDLNFLIYQEIVEVENEINDIIKVILCLPFSFDKGDKLEIILKSIFMQPHWKLYYIGSDLENIFDGYNEDEIINKFITYITSKITPNLDLSDEKKEGISILELVIYEKIVNTIINYINNLHYNNFIQYLSIFYDGIPSISKVIEQRRRRIKNYIESTEKKILFKKYFDNLLPNNKNLFDCLSKKYDNLNIDNIILFDYFKWIKIRFTIDKSIGPSSNFIKNLEQYMNFKIKKILPKINIYINSAKENGESDLKIFKYISNLDLNGDYCIHTTDSDFIHQILIQQSYFKIIGKDINLTVIKYLKNINLIGYLQVLDANLIIKNILDLYNSTNNIKTNNYKIIWDLCFIFYLFGNDHIPSSIEIGPELGLEYYIKSHYQSLDKNNIIILKNSLITIDLKKLQSFFEKIYENNELNITKIILQRFFKINTQLLILLVDKLSLNFEQILDFIKNFIIYCALQKSDEYDEYDLRTIYLKNVSSDLYESYLNLSIFNFKKDKQKLLLDSIDLIKENINWYESEFNGLVLYNKPQNITNDEYQDIYNYISEKASSNLSKKYNNYYDHLNIYQHLDLLKKLDNFNENHIYDYLKKMYHLTITQFGNMGNFHSNNLTWFKYYNVPSLMNIIYFLGNNTDDNILVKKWNNEIKNENIDTDKYLNSINHHLLITPFISNYTLPSNIFNIIKEMKLIDNLWFDSIDTFDYRNINMENFFKSWNNAIININLNINSRINEELVVFYN